jgi:hypothetical protein
MPPTQPSRAPQPDRERPACFRVTGLSAEQERALNQAVHSYFHSGPELAAVPHAGILTAILGRLPPDGGTLLSAEQQRLLSLYFEGVPAATDNVRTLALRVRRRTLLVAEVRTGSGFLYRPATLAPRQSFGREARSLEGTYRHGDLTEAERVRDAGHYTRAGRRFLTRRHPIRGTVTPDHLAFALPRVTDRLARVAFVSLFPKNAHILIHSVGVNYVHSYVEKEIGPDRLRVLNLDLQLTDLDEVGRRLEEIDPDVVGISTKTNSQEALDACLRRLRPRHPGALFVLGGTLATFAWKELLADYPFALLVLDSGEVPMAEVLRLVLGERDPASLASIPNLAFNLDGAPALTPYQDLGVVGHFRPADANVAEVAHRGGIVALRWSEGCWGNCTFCSLPPPWKGADTADVVALLAEWKEKFRIRSLFFTDDEVVPKDPALAYRRLDDFADRLLAAGLGITWTVSLRADCVHWMDAALADKLRRSGCESFFIGVESGSDSQLRRYGKLAHGMLINAAVNARALRFFRDHEIRVGVGWIPFDPAMPTLRELRDNLAFAAANGLVDCNVRLDNALRLQRGAADVNVLGQLGLGLVGELQPNLLFYDATYLDPRAGAIKDHVQAFMDGIRELDGRLHRARFEAAVDPCHADRDLLALGRRLQSLTLAFLAALLAEFPESEEDRRIDLRLPPATKVSLSLVDAAGCSAGEGDVPEQALFPRPHSGACGSREFLAARRERLVREVSGKAPRMLAITLRFLAERDRLVREAGIDPQAAGPPAGDFPC